MASIVIQPNGYRLIQLSEGEHPKRPKIRLRKVNKRQAETAKLYIEDLIGCKASGDPLKTATREWLASVPNFLRKRLEQVGMIEPQERRECPTLAEWLDRYIKSRVDVKESTRLHYEQVKSNLLEFYGKDKRLSQITAGCAEEFRLHLKGKGLAEATIRKRCSRAKQFLTAAVAKEIIKSNPFKSVRCGNVTNTERQYFVSAEEIEAVIAACPDAEWKTIFALARYGGLRVPSEVLLLKWTDIHWDEQRFLVHSPKTAHQGKASRVVPLFPELSAILLSAFENAETGAEFVISRYRSSRSNLRTQAHRIIKLAGLAPWQKVFQNCRSSRETELVEQFPIQTVTAWLGNSPQIAMKHYLQVTEAHFSKAVQIPVQPTSEIVRNTPHEANGEDREHAACGGMHKEAALCVNTGPHSAPRVGLEPTT